MLVLRKNGYFRQDQIIQICKYKVRTELKNVIKPEINKNDIEFKR